MKKLVTTMCALGLLAAPAIADASSQRAQAVRDAKQTCTALQKAAGKKNFHATYGKAHAYGRCVRKETRENRAEAQQAQQQAHDNAAKQCKTERDSMSAEDFQAAYPTKGKHGKNSFGVCVSQHAKQNRQELAAQDEQQDENQVNAAKQCKAEQGLSDEDFQTAHQGEDNNSSFESFYGTNKNHKNAFGKCVSKKAHEMNQADEGGDSTQS